MADVDGSERLDGMLTKILNPVSIKPLEVCVMEQLRNSVRVEIWAALREPIQRMSGAQLGYVALRDSILC